MRLQKVSLPVLNTSFLETTLSPLLLVDCQEVKNWVKCGWLLAQYLRFNTQFSAIQTCAVVPAYCTLWKKKQHWKTLSCEKNCNQKASTWGLCERGHQDYRLLSPGKDRWLASPLPVTSWFIMAPKSKSPTFWEWQKWRHFHHQLLKTKSLTFWYIWNYLHPQKKNNMELEKDHFQQESPFLDSMLVFEDVRIFACFFRVGPWRLS